MIYGDIQVFLLKPQHSNSHRTSMATREQLGTFEFSFDEICQATGNVSAVHKIGEGGFGTVYKGKLKNGFPVAIKRAKKSETNRLFKNEVQALSKIEHLNLVRFYGFLELRDERIIITEYVSNGTLREHLDGRSRKSLEGTEFEVAERLSIAIDVAHAITYLHSYTGNSLQKNFHAKVADFGFARLATDDPCLDPEYLRTYQMTGRHPIETNRTIDETVSIKWIPTLHTIDKECTIFLSEVQAMRIIKHGDSVIAMDPRLRASPSSIMAVEKVLKLARQCLAPFRLARPPMKKCAEVLWGIRTQFVEKSIPKTSTSSHSTNFLGRNNGVVKTQKLPREWIDLRTEIRGNDMEPGISDQENTRREYVFKEPDPPDMREFTNIISRVLSEELLPMDKYG
uniref:Protein kinase domain-containing protein n=1 Tax=Solanum lycopersicum TaxID=4081 RepID=A0A3Q7FM27_SOLLC